MKNIYRKLHIAVAVAVFTMSPMVVLAAVYGDAGTTGATTMRNHISKIAKNADNVVSGRKALILVDNDIPVYSVDCINCWISFHNGEIPVSTPASTPASWGTQKVDVLVTDWPGEWINCHNASGGVCSSGTDGYETAVVHLRYPDGPENPQDGYRLIEIADEHRTSLAAYFPSAPATNLPTRIAVISHIRGFISYHPDLFKMFADAINEQNPDYVFIMGDMVFRSTDAEYADLEQNFFAHLTVPYIMVPGNHEVRAVTAADYVYRRHIGPMPPVIITPTANLLMINSSFELVEVKAQLRAAFKEIEQAGNLGKNTVLLTHHKVWEDWWMSFVNFIKPRFDDEEFVPLVIGVDAEIGQIDSIVDGDKHHSIDLSRKYHNGWSGIQTLSIGNGQKGSNAQLYYSMIELANDKQLRIEPFYFDTDASHPWYTENDTADDR